MTDSMKFIPVPQEIYDILGFTDEGVFTAEISEGKLVLTQESGRSCILPPEADVDCEDCCFCCKCCGECMPHSFDYDKRQEDVTVAYGRDRGETNIEARTLSMAELDNPENWTEYVYIFNKDNGWKYFKSGYSDDGLRDIEEDLKTEYARYGVDRIPDHYGFVTQDIVDYLLKEQEETVISDAELENAEPTVLM